MKEKKHYKDSVFYSMEQAVTYLRLVSSQLFKKLNIDISVDQFIALDTINCNENVCQRDLSKLILKDRPCTTRLLESLEDKGFVKRTVGAKKNRLVKKVFVTEKGKQILEKNKVELTNSFYQFFENISEEEIETLEKILNKIKISLGNVVKLSI